MYIAAEASVLFSTDSPSLIKNVIPYYEEQDIKKLENGYYDCILKKPALTDRSVYTTTSKNTHLFDDIASKDFYDLRVLAITAEYPDYNKIDLSRFEVLITIGYTKDLKELLEKYPKLRVFQTASFKDATAFCEMLLLLMASDNIIEVDFFDIALGFASTSEKSKLIHHYSLEEAANAPKSECYALVYVYTNKKDLFEINTIYEKYSFLSVPNEFYMACSCNTAIQERNGVFLSY